ncbi:uncharacterized [Tachysurus ichikawai]
MWTSTIRSAACSRRPFCCKAFFKTNVPVSGRLPLFTSPDTFATERTLTGTFLCLSSSSSSIFYRVSSRCSKYLKPSSHPVLNLFSFSHHDISSDKMFAGQTHALSVIRRAKGKGRNVSDDAVNKELNT